MPFPAGSCLRGCVVDEGDHGGPSLAKVEHHAATVPVMAGVTAGGNGCREERAKRIAQDIGSGFAPSFGGKGMNSPLSRSGSFMRPAAQSARAWSIRSGDEDTKFQSM